MKKSTSVHTRGFAREQLFKAIYGWRQGGSDIVDAVHESLERNSRRRMDHDYLRLLTSHCVHQGAMIKEVLAEHMVLRGSVKCTPVEEAILLMACAELLFCHDTPTPVIIDEAVELSKQYGTESGYKLVHGVLDSVHKQIREQSSED